MTYTPHAHSTHRGLISIANSAVAAGILGTVGFPLLTLIAGLPLLALTLTPHLHTAWQLLIHALPFGMLGTIASALLATVGGIVGWLARHTR